MSMKNIYETEFQKIISDEKEYLEKNGFNNMDQFEKNILNY